MSAARNDTGGAEPASASEKARRGLHRARRAAGVTLIALCGLGWIGVVAAPFLGLSAGRLAAVIAALIIAAEGAFALGVVLLGKEIFHKIKAFLKLAKRAGEKT